MKINKKVLTWIAPLSALGIGLYFLSRKKTQDLPNVPEPISSGEWKNYKVNTIASPLNVRKSPDKSSEKIGSLPKGSTIKARPSSSFGWYEYSSDGENISGYVSQQYLQIL